MEKTYFRPGGERGHATFGWLDARHTFSFGSYYDAAHMGFGPLRVINEDRIAGGGGFAPHGHVNMEIITYVLSGTLAHNDSTDGAGTISHGEVQVMSAGSGIRHSEMNATSDVPVHLLQIWIEPREMGLLPRYEDRAFPLVDGLTLLVSGSGRDESLQVAQDMELHRIIGEGSFERGLVFGSAWIQVISGCFQVDGLVLSPGDGLGLRDIDTLRFEASRVDGTQPEALIFDLRA